MQERLSGSRERAQERRRADLIIKASENIIRLADVDGFKEARKSIVRRSMGNTATTAQILYHPYHPTIIDYRLFNETHRERVDDDTPGAEIIPLPRSEDIVDTPAEDAPLGELIIDPRIHERPIYLVGYHRGSPDAS